MKKVDITTLTNIDDVPQMRQGNKELADARHQLDETQQRRTQAQTDLDDAERAAATGTRDDKRLRTAREALTHWESEHRIAQRRVEAAEQHATGVKHDALLEVERDIKDAYSVEIRAMYVALDVARQHSWAALELEEVSAQVFSGGMYRREPGRPLPHAAWTDVFGGRKGPLHDTKFETRKRLCGVTFDE